MSHGNQQRQVGQQTSAVKPAVAEVDELARMLWLELALRGAASFNAETLAQTAYDNAEAFLKEGSKRREEREKNLSLLAG